MEEKESVSVINQGDKGYITNFSNENLHDESSVNVSEKAKRKLEEKDSDQEDRHRKKKKKVGQFEYVFTCYSIHCVSYI